MISELRSQLAAKERERQKYIDILAQMGWGVKVFGADDQPEIEETPAATTSSNTPTVPLARMRPTQAARVISGRLQREYEDKIKDNRKNAALQQVAAVIGEQLAQQ